MEIIKLTSRQRSGTGKSYTRKARVQGWVPAVYYGHNRSTLSIEVDAKEFATLVRKRKTTHLVDLGLGKSQDDSIAVIKDIHRHVLKSESFIHIDFQHVAMNEKVTVRVPVELSGIPIGVKDNNGILDHPVKAVSIECFPMDIPEKIVVDVSALDIGNSIHIRDVVVPNITIKESADEVLATVTHPTREASVEGAAAEGGEAAAAGPAAPAAATAAPAGKAAPAAGKAAPAAPAAKAAAPAKGKK
ncbi:MAG TPA: 50S ribosomal protein L25 [Chitinispirillaceae bacterium]|nr:50S ribosomal protein L25 [Chitinispirillaceae bacterium]